MYLASNVRNKRQEAQKPRRGGNPKVTLKPETQYDRNLVAMKEMDRDASTTKSSGALSKKGGRY